MFDIRSGSKTLRHGLWSIQGNVGRGQSGELSARQVSHKCDTEADKPCVIVETNEKGRNIIGFPDLNLDKKAGKAWQNGEHESDEGHDAEAVGETILTVSLIQGS